MMNHGLLMEQTRKKVMIPDILTKTIKILSRITKNKVPLQKEEEYCLARIAELQDKIKDLNKWNEFKCKRR